jgi:hypothetical protein
VKWIKSARLWWAGHTVHVSESDPAMKSTFDLLLGERTEGRSKRKWIEEVELWRGPRPKLGCKAGGGRQRKRERDICYHLKYFGLQIEVTVSKATVSIIHKELFHVNTTGRLLVSGTKTRQMHAGSLPAQSPSRGSGDRRAGLWL